MSIVNTIKIAFVNALMYIGKERGRRQLLDLSDRQLADFGFSRELLEDGVSAWPWRLEEDSRTVHSTAVEGIAVKPSLAGNTISLGGTGLSIYSNRESAELGIHGAVIAAAQRAA